MQRKIGKMGVSSGFVLGVFCFVNVVNGQEQCNGELWCERGHCCGSDGTHCCTYYYELWWFWMIWGLIILLSCCCLYQQHRLKKRQRRALRAMSTGLSGRPSSPFNSYAETFAESEFRLPTYDEVQDLPKDPPAYEVLFDAVRQESETALPSVAVSTDGVPDSQAPLSPSTVLHSSPDIISESEEVGLLAHEVVPGEDPPPAYTATATATASASASPAPLPAPPPTSPH